MTFQRDPLSVLYDQDAAEVLDRLYATRMAGGSARTLAYVASPLLARPDDYDGSLTAQERAFARALHWNLKRRRPARAIRLSWAGDVLPGLGRPVTIAMFTAGSARDHAEAQPEARLWSMNPQLRSAGLQ